MTGVKETEALLKVLSAAPELTDRKRHQAELLAKSLEDNGKLGRREVTIFLEVVSSFLRVLRRA